MAFAKKETYSVDNYKGKYQEITALYAHADELIATVESDAVNAPHEQLNMVETLVNEVADATDILAEEFILVAESQKPRAISKFSKKRIEGALRRVFVALADYQANTKQFMAKSGGKIVNIADKIVKKIEQQVDKIVVIFLELINISLQNIMGKVEMDALRARNARVALMMHQISLSQHS